MLPEEFLLRMKTLLGAQYIDFLQAMEGERSYGLRLNPLKAEQFTAPDDFGLRPVPWARDGFYYDPDARPGRHPYYEAGVYYIQEPSAMAVGALANVQPGMRVLDLCAAPGGKTTHLAGQMQGQGILVANEIHPARAKILAQSVERAGVHNCMVTNETPQRLAQRFPAYFDCIVVDAPCSGEGMFRKEQIAVQEWTPESPEKCAARQDEILDCAAHMLRADGRLVYSTCTFAPEEDEGSVQRFLDRHPDWQVQAMPDIPWFAPGRPEWIPHGSPDLKNTFRLFPHLLEGEGHFVAVLRRTGGQDCQPKLAQPLSEREIPQEYRAWERAFLYVKFERLTRCGDVLWVLPEGLPDGAGLRVLRQGLELGTCKKGRFEPAHALALALQPSQAVHRLSLCADGSEIVRYLRGETLPCVDGEGWTLVDVDGYTVGWGKVSGGVLKNHYPKGLRWK